MLMLARRERCNTFGQCRITTGRAINLPSIAAADAIVKSHADELGGQIHVRGLNDGRDFGPYDLHLRLTCDIDLGQNA